MKCIFQKVITNEVSDGIVVSTSNLEVKADSMNIPLC